MKIYLIVALLVVVQSCSIVGYFQANKKIKADYIVELKPKDSHPVHDRSVNVIQGIATFENGYFTSQTTAGTYLIFNFLDAKGNSRYATRLAVDSHAQDLSFEQVAEDSLVFYTSVGKFDKDGTSGIMTIGVKLPPKINGIRDMSKIKVDIIKKYMLGYRNCTPTLSNDGKKIALRSGNAIFYGDKNDILSSNKQKIYTFDLSKEQLIGENNETLWFQGLVMDDSSVYCITGNNSIGSYKKIFKYNLKGEILRKIVLDKDEFGRKVGSKLEPEGMFMIGNDLYYTIMTKGVVGGNRKFLFKVGV